jgi:hypothetical protein
MWEDPIVSDVRRAREELASRFNFDVKAIFADMRARQAALGTRLVSRKKRNRPPNGTAEETKSPPGVPSSTGRADF